MNGVDLDRMCTQILGDNYISWHNDQDKHYVVHLHVKTLPNLFQRDEIRSVMPAGISVMWRLRETNYPITIDTN